MTSGGAREFKLETPNLFWLMLIVSSICVPNFITIRQAVLWAAIESRVEEVEEEVEVEVEEEKEEEEGQRIQ